MSEASLMRRIMLSLSKRCILFRNQSGFYVQDGRPIRYGIANPGGSDLIGWTPVEITPEMVGKRIAIFTALEVKTDKGRPTKEQLAFIEAVKRAGGIAEIVRSEDDAENTVDVFTTR
jgi:hypothetical protein